MDDPKRHEAITSKAADADKVSHYYQGIVGAILQEIGYNVYEILAPLYQLIRNYKISHTNMENEHAIKVATDFFCIILKDDTHMGCLLVRWWSFL